MTSAADLGSPNGAQTYVGYALSMKLWMLPWLVPVVLLAAVSISAVSGLLAFVLWVGLGWVLIPLGGAYVFSPSRNFGDGSHSPQLDMGYWRSKPL